MPTNDGNSSDPRGVLPSAESSKEGRYQKVASAVVTILLARGPRAVTVSAVARRAGVSRPWIYKYFGSNVDEMLAFTASSYGGAFIETQLHEPAVSESAWRQSLVDGTLEGLDDVDGAKWIITMYFRFRYDRGVLGDAIRDVEESHVQKVYRAMPHKMRVNKRAARRFALSFTKARLGVYNGWLDSDYRAQGSPDEIVADLMGMVDGYIARYATAQH